MKMQPTLTIESLWTLKYSFLLLRKETRIFLSLLMPLATFLSLTLLLIFPLKMLLHPWKTKFGQNQYLVTDRGAECPNQDMAHSCSIFDINHSPRTPFSPWTNGLVEVQNHNLRLT